LFIIKFVGSIFFLIGVIVFSGEVFIGLLVTIVFGLIAVAIFKGGEYKPGKSFRMERLDKQVLNKYIKYSAIGLVAFILIFILIIILIGGERPNLWIWMIDSIIVSGVGLYYFAKSVKFHEDIDYESNERLAELIGEKVDEKIIASYQNFDGNETKRRKNENIIVVTNRKIFFAVFNGTNWMTLNKLFSGIQQIGVTHNDVNYFLKLVFTDNTSLGLRLDEKMTTTPQLFIRQFLTALDSYLLGYDAVPTTSRRRVSVETGTAEAKNQPAVKTCIIELNTALINDLKQAEAVQPGRVLEL
jgi:hypothetical protein